jgi:V8-like Glu-specific endopeptidase
MFHMSLTGLVLVALFIAAIVWAHGYAYGKFTMVDMFSSHLANHWTLQQAVRYEKDVLEGKVPRG